MGRLVIDERGIYTPEMFLSTDYRRKNGNRSPFPNVGEVVGKVMEEFPGFSEENIGVVLYECSHSNGFASTNAQVVRYINPEGRLQRVYGVVGAKFSNLDVSDVNYITQFERKLDKAGLAHVDSKPDEISLNLRDRQIISSMKVNSDYRFSLFRNQPRSDIRMFTNTAYVESRNRDFILGEGIERSLKVLFIEAIKKDAQNVAAITQAMNEVFTPDFLRFEEPKEEPEPEEWGL